MAAEAESSSPRQRPGNHRQLESWGFARRWHAL